MATVLFEVHTKGTTKDPFFVVNKPMYELTDSYGTIHISLFLLTYVMGVGMATVLFEYIPNKVI